MLVNPDPEAQKALLKWSKLETTSPALADVLEKTRGWATGNECLFERTDTPTLSIDELKYYDGFGTPERYLTEVWFYGPELARQVQEAKDEELKSREEARKRDEQARELSKKFI